MVDFLEHPAASANSPTLLQTILESLVDGVLILTDRGEWLCSNANAERLCQRLSQSQNAERRVPQPIWRLCQMLIERRRLEPELLTVLALKIVLPKLAMFRARASWIKIDDMPDLCLLVTLEDCHQSALQQAIADAQKYDLTPRQTEVWQLRWVGYSYREIATELYISVETVKKHLHDIYIKQHSEESATEAHPFSV